ncbi:hypothetical protein [Rhodopseudomonas sp.]|uniref:hypothetical protein n=1 Tax=Rhodopseudomonas sp. TaxID=1078 RepID=UPI003B3BB29E
MTTIVFIEIPVECAHPARHAPCGCSSATLRQSERHGAVKRITLRSPAVSTSTLLDSQIAASLGQWNRFLNGWNVTRFCATQSV